MRDVLRWEFPGAKIRFRQSARFIYTVRAMEGRHADLTGMEDILIRA
jgi:hypothetical protein